MARPGRIARPALTRLALSWLGRACVLTAVAATVAGCVNMPDSGPTGAISASPQSTAAGGNFIEPFPSGPTPGEDPTHIVNGFLAASASYPVYAAIAREYLVSSASKHWNLTWSVRVFSSFKVTGPPPPRGSGQAEVGYSGDVQSRFDGTGQFVSATVKAAKTSGWTFHLVRVGGQWRISNPPTYRLLSASQFTEFYRAQDLYFVDQSIAPGAANQALVPAAVFVPLGTSTDDLATNLVTALLPDSAGQPNSTWLQNAAGTFPAGTMIDSVTLDGTTAVVNLDGLADASNTVLEQVSAQLTWTLASPRAGPPAAIQSVELERDGRPWIPPGTICGSQQIRSAVQNQAIYPCYNPYPSQPASFAFTDHGQVWSRCGSEAIALRGRVGPVVPVFGSASALSSQPCGRQYVDASSPAAPAVAPLPAKDGTPSLVAVSPDGQYVAYFAPDKKAVFTGLSSAAASLHPVPGGVGSGVTALSWGRNHDLWIAQNGDVYMVPVNQSAIQVTTAPPNVTALSVAPDGVRIALVAQPGAGPEVQLAAIVHGGQSPQRTRASLSEAISLGTTVQVGPDLANPNALTWYDADDLIVLAGGATKTLSEVPVDGQNSSSSVTAPAGTEAITASGAANALVAGLSGHRLDVSTGLEGPWQSLGVLGQNPAYPG